MAKRVAPKSAPVQEYSGPVTKICPRCERRKNVEEKFGYRITGNKVRAQSYCTECRKTPVAVTPAKPKKVAVKAEPTRVKPVSMSVVKVTTDVEQTRKVFQSLYPNNKQKYGWKTMVARIVRKTGEDVLTPQAYAEYAV